jgi:hypothetical protein
MSYEFCSISVGFLNQAISGQPMYYHDCKNTHLHLAIRFVFRFLLPTKNCLCFLKSLFL